MKNKKGGIFLIAVIILLVLLISSGILYFRFTSSGLEVFAGNTSLIGGNSSVPESSQSLNLSAEDNRIVINQTNQNSSKENPTNRTKIEIIEINMSG